MGYCKVLVQLETGVGRMLVGGKMGPLLKHSFQRLPPTSWGRETLLPLQAASSTLFLFISSSSVCFCLGNFAAIGITDFHNSSPPLTRTSSQLMGCTWSKNNFRIPKGLSVRWVYTWKNSERKKCCSYWRFFNWTVECRVGSAKRGVGRGALVSYQMVQAFTNAHEWGQPMFLLTTVDSLSKHGDFRSCYACLFPYPPRLSLLWNAGHGVGTYFRLPDHGVQSRGQELDAWEHPPGDQPLGLGPAPGPPPVRERVAAGGPRWGEDCAGGHHSGGQAPGEQGVHEEIQDRVQQQRLGLEDADGWQQAQGQGEPRAGGAGEGRRAPWWPRLGPGTLASSCGSSSHFLKAWDLRGRGMEPARCQGRQEWDANSAAEHLITGHLSFLQETAGDSRPGEREAVSVGPGTWAGATW